MRRAIHLAIAIAALVTASAAVPARLGAATNPIATPTGMVRFYFHALNTGQCALAFKFAGQTSRSLSAFQRDCRTIRRITIERLGDPAGVALPTAKSTVFPSGSLLQPSFFARAGLLPELVGFYRPKPRANWSRLYVFRSTDRGKTWRRECTGPR